MKATNTPIALITGGSRGLGRSMALHLARQGVDIVLTYQREASQAQAAVSEVEAMGRHATALQLDIGNSTGFSAFADEIQKLLRAKWQREHFNFLVNNAGMGVHALVADTTEAQFDQLMNVHLKGPFFLTQKLLPLIVNGGRILNLSTGLTRFAMPGYAAYAAMKGGVEVLSRYLAKELGERRISVNTVAPGAIATDFGGGAVRDNPQINGFVASQTALGRVGEADDIGALVAGLLSSTGDWVNGQRIEASGGIFI
jgi:NAD(P)-dependent dehydrogenase (short-subunit alcohol dehydrogenase family)